jgi:serine/threonine-protein kinase
MSRCTSCWSEVSEGSRFCASCGAPAESPDSFATQTVATSTPRGEGTGAGAAVSRSSHISHTRSQGRFPPGTLLGGRYRIVAMLGKGGMGEVYRADDLSLDQPVALKFLPEALALHEDALARFRNEVRIARQVSHPNVCRVYDMGEMEGQYFLSMEYVDGEDLGSLLRRIGRLPADKALEIARKLCAGLAAAHEKGVLHRDLKPANVMLDARGQVLLADFGLAALAEGVEAAEIRNGTPAYMAPEQLAGEEVTVRSDIYALGLVLYEIFTGKLPFESTTLAGLMRAQRESSPVSPASLVRDLDPMVERVILRCLNPKPSLRPPSALAVAAALPGGDPLAAALAAGETPSPEMVAAAGEGEGLAPRIAIALLLFTIAASAAVYALNYRNSAIVMLQPEFGPEVMAQKARDTLQKLGIGDRPADEAWGFSWDHGLFDWFRDHSKPAPDWRAILGGGAPALDFWYRRAGSPMTGVMFHDDLLTPGIVLWDDPPPLESSMVRLALDSQGRLLLFERIPEQLETAPGASAPVDWSPLFALAGLDQSKFTPAAPLWNSLAASDARAAWTTESPRAIRVEAAALRGAPVYFSRIEPWAKPDRAAASSSSTQELITFAVLGTVLVVICFAAGVLARRNLKQQRGDRRGALRLAVFFSCIEIALWLARGHFTVSFGTFGVFILAMCSSVFYGVIIWTVYIALEPYVRRRWPHTLISWSAVLIGRVRDAVVGRDVLVGCAAGAAIQLVACLTDTWVRLHGRWKPNLDATAFLEGIRPTFAWGLAAVPHAIREALFFFLLIFLLRVLLRNQWIAAAVFAAIFVLPNTASGDQPWLSAALSFVLLFGIAALVLRLGVVTAATALLFTNLVNGPAIGQASAWYAGSTIFMLGAALVLALWAFKTSLGSRTLWGPDLLG